MNQWVTLWQGGLILDGEPTGVLLHRELAGPTDDTGHVQAHFLLGKSTKIAEAMLG